MLQLFIHVMLKKFHQLKNSKLENKLIVQINHGN